VTPRAQTRRGWLGGALGGALALAAAPAWARRIKLEPDDMAIGSPKARVTVVEYASTGCPHCAKWSNEVFPAFKARFIDTGKVRFVMRECVTGDPDLAAAGFMLARCAGPANYFDVVEKVFQHQAEIVQSADTGASLLHDIGLSAGLSDAAYQACLSDKAGFAAVQARSERHADADKVDSTPTFEVNGKRIEGYVSLDDLAAAIAAARRRA
jgi:protein-disulfide isomerase